ncbi:protein prenylyltransferase [Dichotomocladium elegans]|nr:protein prenylyltransferase [Dichotomocladium elegans]
MLALRAGFRFMGNARRIEPFTLSGIATPMASTSADWSDVTPIPQDDGPNPLVPIAYSSDYKQAMDLFRAISLTEEKSPRVLELLGNIIEMNPAHYTVWKYRQDVIFGTNANLEKELDFVDEVAEGQAKNYQIWHYRQVIVDKLGDGSRELNFINRIVDEDSKNYHAWSYRQWVVNRFNLWDGEMQYTDDLLVYDVRNNSAWNHRYYVLFSRPGGVTEEDLENEIDFVKHKIRQAPNNPSPWSYLSGLLEASSKPFSRISEFLFELRDKEIKSPHLLSMLIDMYEAQAKENPGSQVNPDAIQICDDLATRFDVIRRNYWQYRKKQLAAHIHADTS